MSDTISPTAWEYCLRKLATHAMIDVAKFFYQYQRPSLRVVSATEGTLRITKESGSTGHLCICGDVKQGDTEIFELYP